HGCTAAALSRRRCTSRSRTSLSSSTARHSPARDHHGRLIEMPARRPPKAGSELILDLVLGMVGAAVGGFIFSGLFGMSGVTGLNIWSIIVSVIGAIIVLWIYEALVART